MSDGHIHHPGMSDGHIHHPGMYGGKEATYPGMYGGRETTYPGIPPGYTLSHSTPPWVHHGAHPSPASARVPLEGADSAGQQGPGLCSEISLGNDAHRALPSPKGVTVMRRMVRRVTPLLRRERMRRLDRSRGNPGKTSRERDLCAKWSSFRPSDVRQQ